MKKISIFCVAVLFIAIFAACGKEEKDESTESAGETITSTIPTAFPEKHIKQFICEALYKGYTRTYNYKWEGGLLKEITNDYGMTINFSYQDGRIDSVVYHYGDDDILHYHTYHYDENGKIAEVLYKYKYEEEDEDYEYKYSISYLDEKHVNIRRIEVDNPNIYSDHSVAWENGNVVNDNNHTYSYTTGKNPFYFPILYIIHDKDITIPGFHLWSVNLPYGMGDAVYAKWTLGSDGYPISGEGGKGSTADFRYTFIYED